MLSQQRDGSSGSAGVVLHELEATMSVEGVEGAHSGLNGTRVPLRKVVLMLRENGLAVDEQLIEALGLDFFMFLCCNCTNMPSCKRKSSVLPTAIWCVLCHARSRCGAV
jgi:hypothetical protein